MATNDNFFPVPKYSLFDRLAVRMLQCGPFPKHVAFILDGNRRYAKSKHIKLMDGYNKGAVNMIEKFTVCTDIGIQCVTLYLFSIENFHRPKEQLDELMDRLYKHFLALTKNLQEFNARQICIRFYGKIELFPMNIQKLVAQIALHTANNNKFYLNYCASYTAREEMVRAMEDLQFCAKNELINPINICHSIFANALYSRDLPEPDILVRTSGVHRLSDFQLWQTGFSHVSFVDEQWPEYSKYSLFKAILQYQIKYESIMRLRVVHEQRVLKSEYEYFVQSSDNFGCTLEKFITLKNQQIETFQNYIRQKRIEYFANIFKQS